MKTALVFPGQGSQAVGMGKALAREFPAARDVFKRVDAALSQNLSRLMFEGPEAEPHVDRQRPAGADGREHSGLARSRNRNRLQCREASGLRRRPFARRLYGSLRRGSLTLEDAARLLASARRGHAEGRAGGKGRDGRHHRPRIWGGREDRRSSGERPLSHRRNLPCGDRQRRRSGRRFGHDGVRSSARRSSPSSPAPSGL